MFKGLQWKIVLLYSLLILFALQVIGVYLVQSLERYYLQNFVEGVEAQAKLLSSFLTPRIYEEESTYVADIVEGFKATRDIDIIVMDRYARVTGTSGADDMIGGRIIQEEVTRALAGTASEAIRVNPENDRRYHYLAYPVKDEGAVTGVIYLSSSLHKIDQTLGEVRGIIITGSVIVLAISFMVGMVLTRTITSPITEVTHKAAQMAQGDFSQRIKAHSEDEIGQLIHMYNYLASRLNSTLNEISSEKSKVEAILNYMRDGVLAMDDSGSLIHINPAAEKLLGSLAAKPLQIGKPPAFLLHELIGKKRMEKFNRYREPLSFEVTWDNPLRILRLNMAPFPVEEGKQNGMLVVLQDITRESEINRRQQEFVANVSHELKTPLTSIKSYVETLLEEALENKEIAYNFLKVVNSETERMVLLVKDLLTLSRLDVQQEEFERSGVYLGDMLQEIVGKMQFQKTVGPEIRLNIPADMPGVYVDRSQINQVFVNLLNNALQYTPADGLIEIFAERRDDWIYVCVRDNGIGIPEEEIPRVFERFYRVDKTRSRDFGGTGLGLSISRQAVEAHGGLIWIESELQKGTSVWFTLPVFVKEDESNDA